MEGVPGGGAAGVPGPERARERFKAQLAAAAQEAPWAQAQDGVY